MSDDSITTLDWDSTFFGFKIGRANSQRFDERDSEIVERAKEIGIRCLYFLVDADSAATLAALHSFGGKFVDGRLRLVRPADRVSEGDADEETIRPAGETDFSELVEISEEIEWDTRFFKDTLFPIERSREMYSKWIARDLSEGIVLAAVDSSNGRIQGFLSYTMDEKEAVSVIQLLAVRESARGQGVADRLLSEALRRIRSTEEAAEVQVVTQSSNIPAQRLYQKHGFRSSSVQLWFHLWL